jgi:predicted MFS family arabinose efflux permease
MSGAIPCRASADSTSAVYRRTASRSPLGVALIVFFVPLAFWLVRDRPEDVGLLPDGRRAVPETPERAGAPEPAAEHSWTLREAVRTRAFWCVMICGAVMAMVLTGITFQLFPILAERGIDRTTTAFMLSLVPVISFVCSLIAGFVVERVHAHLVLGLAFLLCAATPVMLMHAGSMAAVILFAATWGIAQGFMNIPLGVLWPNYFGRRHLAGIQGVTHTAMVIGSALGPVQFGWAFDRFGSYDSVLLASAGIWVLGAALAFLATPPVRRMEKDAA